MNNNYKIIFCSLCVTILIVAISYKVYASYTFTTYNHISAYSNCNELMGTLAMNTDWVYADCDYVDVARDSNGHQRIRLIFVDNPEYNYTAAFYNIGTSGNTSDIVECSTNYYVTDHVCCEVGELVTLCDVYGEYSFQNVYYRECNH